MAKRIKLPTRFIRVDASAKTIAARDESGRFRGRRGPESKRTRKNPYIYPYHGPGDTTKARRVVRDIDLDKDGKVDFFGGTIQGRTVKVRASKRSKGYERRI